MIGIEPVTTRNTRLSSSERRRGKEGRCDSSNAAAARWGVTDPFPPVSFLLRLSILPPRFRGARPLGSARNSAAESREPVRREPVRREPFRREPFCREPFSPRAFFAASLFRRRPQRRASDGGTHRIPQSPPAAPSCRDSPSPLDPFSASSCQREHDQPHELLESESPGPRAAPREDVGGIEQKCEKKISGGGELAGEREREAFTRAAGASRARRRRPAWP